MWTHLQHLVHLSVRHHQKIVQLHTFHHHSSKKKGAWKILVSSITVLQQNLTFLFDPQAVGPVQTV